MMYYKKQKGAILLMTLIAALVLTVFIARNFENTSKELVSLKNEEIDFQLETISRSILKFLLLAIKSADHPDGPGAGANIVFEALSILKQQNIPIPLFADDIPDLFLTEPEIWSMNHYFYIGSTLNSGEEKKVFTGIIKKVFTEVSSDSIDEQIYNNTTEKICNFLGSKRCNDSRNETFGNQITIAPKNELLDSRSELKFLIASVINEQNIEINNTVELEKNIEYSLPIRLMYIVDPYKPDNKLNDKYNKQNQCNIGKLNLNMLPKLSLTEFDQYLENYFEFVEYTSNKKECKQFIDKKAELTARIKDQFRINDTVGENGETEEVEETEEEESPFDDIFSSFWNIGQFDFRHNARIIRENESFFTYRSNLLGMRFNIEFGDIIRTVTAHLHLIYNGNNKTAMPDRIEVLYYKID